jgi:MFS family permease
MRMISPYPVFIGFFIYSFGLGTLFPRIGDIQLSMGLGEGALGLALVGLPVGLQISLLIADRVLRRYSVRLVMIVGMAMIAMSYVGAAFASTPVEFFFSLLFGGLAVGAIEVVLNLEADRVENKLGYRIMNRAHAFWSLGFFGTGILGAVVSQLNIPVQIHFICFGIIAVLVTAIIFIKYQPAPQRSSLSEDKPMFVRPTHAVMMLVYLTLPAMLAEGSAIDWSVIYMRDVFDTPPIINGLALALTAFCQFLARYFADGYVDKYGPRKIVTNCLWLLLIGSLIIIFSPYWVLSLLGFAFLGIGSSVIFPLSMSAAAQLKDRSAAVNIAALAQVSFFVFLAAPPLLGLVAEQAGIRHAFSICLPLVLLAFYNLKGLAGAQKY